MPSNRFSRRAIINRYFKSFHGYALIIYLLFSFSEIAYLFGGGKVMGGRILNNVAKQLEPIFFEYSMLVLLLSINILIVLHAEYFNKTEGDSK